MIFAAAMVIPLLFCACCQLYQLWLLAAAMLDKRQLWQAPRFAPSECCERPHAEPAVDASAARFLIILPAHNEELLLGAALKSINSLNYPGELVSVLVIADNCDDKTSEIATASGVLSVVRTDRVRVGKGYTLQDTFEELLGSTEESKFEIGRREFDAVVLLDADSIVHSEMLNSFARRLREGEEALQACYGVLNPEDSVRTKLMTCALALVHLVKPAGRERLQLSDGLKGNGICVTRRVLNTVSWSGDSITEDIDYTMRLAEAGIRIGFVPDAMLWAQMPASASAAAGQRARWESGRYKLLLTRVPSLLVLALRRRDWRLLDRIIELIIPPFAELTAIQTLMLAISLVALRETGSYVSLVISSMWLELLMIQASYLSCGLWLARIPARIAASLLYAPIYIVWKLGVVASATITRKPKIWRRTERTQP